MPQEHAEENLFAGIQATALLYIGDQIDDDKIPTAMVFAGTGMIAAALVKDAVIMHHVDTNYLHPPVIDWREGLNRIGFSADNPWYQAQMIILQTFINAWDGGFGIMPFAHFGPTDLANQMRGNELFTDVYECEENVHELLECCTKAIIATETDIQINHLHGYDVEGFTFGSWTPCGGYLSCDFGDLVSPSVLRKFERPYFDRIVAEWGGAYLHHHELGRHQIPVWAENDNVWIQFVHRDPNTQHLASIIDETIINNSRRTPIQFISTYDEFMLNANKWSQGKFIVEVACDNMSQIEQVLTHASKFKN